jgi:hypothetical protein
LNGKQRAGEKWQEFDLIFCTRTGRPHGGDGNGGVNDE